MEGCFNTFSAEIIIFPANQASTMAVDALAPCIARSSAAMILAVCNVDILIFFGSEFKKTCDI